MREYTVRMLTKLALFSSVAGVFLPSALRAAPPPRMIQQKLIHAVIQDQIDAIPALLQRGGDPNARVAPDKEDAWALQNINDDDPAPPLIVLACRYGSIQGPKAIDLLLKKGANVNIADRNGVTPLMVASELGMGSVDVLLAHGAKVNVKDKNGKTPLMYALNNRGLNTAALLLEKGANINAQDSGGSTPLMIAIRQAAHDPILLYGEDLVEKTRDERVRYRELIEFLITHRADVNTKDKAGNTALKIALAQQQTEAAQLLRNAGAKE